MIGAGAASTEFFVSASSDAACLTIAVNGPLRAACAGRFQEALRRTARPGMRYRVDLSACTAIDSAAVGAFLMMREQALRDNAGAVILEGAQGQTARVLGALCLDRLFEIRTKQSPGPTRV